MKLASVTGNRNYNYIKYGFEIDFKGELKMARNSGSHCRPFGEEEKTHKIQKQPLMENLTIINHYNLQLNLV